MDEKLQQLWDRQDKLEERIRFVENQQAGTIIYIKEIKEDLKEIKEDIKKIKPSDIKSEKFWDNETKKSALKWAAIIILVVLVLIAGRGIWELVNIIPKG